MVTVYHYSTVNSVKILIFTIFFAFVGGFGTVGNENSLLPNLPFVPLWHIRPISVARMAASAAIHGAEGAMSVGSALIQHA